MDERRAVGVDIGGTHTKVALVRAGGEVLKQAELDTASHGDPEPFLGELKAAIAQFAPQGARGIGLAVPGLFAPGGRSAMFSPNTPSLVGLDYFDRLADLGLPIRLEQDLNAPALAEYHFGAGKGAVRLLTAAVGTGLGAAVLVEGEVLRFAGNTAGDNGHIILDPGGPACTAGCQGCAEALTTVAAIERAALQHQGEPAAAALRLAAVDGRITAHAVIAAARAGDALATSIMRGIGQWLGQWLASLAPIFLPERVVLCGGVAEAGQSLLDAASERLHALTGPDYAHCTVVLGAFGGRAGVIGAAVPFLLEA